MCFGYERWRLQVRTVARANDLAQTRLVEARPGLLRELSLRQPIFLLSERMSRSGEETSPKRESE